MSTDGLRPTLDALLNWMHDQPKFVNRFHIVATSPLMLLSLFLLTIMNGLTPAVAGTFELNFNLTKPGQSQSETISVSMPEVNQVKSIRLCEPDCTKPNTLTSPDGTLELPDGASWRIERSDERTCFFPGASDIRTCTEKWKVTLTSPRDTPSASIARKYQAAINVEFSGRFTQDADNFFLSGVYEYDAPAPDPARGVVELSTDGVTVTETTGPATLQVLRTGGSAGVLSVQLRTRAGTAVDGDDYTGIPNGRTLRWEDGDTKPRDVSIDVLTDTLIEKNEQFEILLAADDTSIIGTPSVATVTINDVPPAERGVAELSTDSLTVSETTGPATLQVLRTGGSAGVLSVQLRTSSGTAVDGEDYTGISDGRTLRWEDGDTTPFDVSIDILTDTLNEDNEQFEIQIVADDTSLLGTPSVATITINDVPPAQRGVAELSTDSLTVTETTGPATLQVLRTGGSDGVLSVQLRTSNGTAVDGDDYTGISDGRTLRWEDGDTTPFDVSIDILTDTLNEDDEQFEIQIVADDTSLIGTPSVATVTINDVPPAERGVAELSTDSLTVTETTGPATLQVLRTGGSAGVLSVQLRTSNGTAVDGDDYTGISDGRTLRWEDGDTTPFDVSIDILTDTLNEDDEQFEIQIVADDTSLIGTPSVATVTINDVPPAQRGVAELSTDSLTVTETTGPATLQVLRTGGSDGVLSVQLRTSNGTAVDGDDYTGISDGRTLRWEDGDTTPFDVSIDILTDTLNEGNEQFEIQIVADDTSLLGTPSVATITINDVPPAQRGVAELSTDSLTVTETTGPATLQVLRTGGSDGVLSVQLRTSNGTAVDGDDYTGISDGRTLRWEDGDTTPFDVSIDILTDTLNEGNEQFEIQIVADDTSLIGTPSVATVTINDVPPAERGVAELSTDSLTVTETTGPATLQVLRTGGSAGVLSVQLRTSNGTAVDGDDYTGISDGRTLRWEDGDTTPFDVSIDILTDTLNEGNEQFEIQIVADDTSLLGTPSVATVTITDVPPAERGIAELSIDALTVSETTGPATLQVLRTGGSAGVLSVQLRTSNGTAVDGEDYTGISDGRTLRWEDGDTEPLDVPIDILTDTLIEENEQFEIQIVADDTSLIGTPSVATVTITNVPPAARGVAELSTDALTVSENDGTARIQVLRVGGSNGELSVFVNTQNGTALSGEDYNSLPSPTEIRWDDGDTSPRDVTIQILTDAITEPDETFAIALSSEDSSALGEVTNATVTIQNVDKEQPGVIEFAVATADALETAGSITISVVRNGGSAGRMTAELTSQDGSATNNLDYTGLNGPEILIWENGDATTKTVDIPILVDTLSEVNETFTLTLSDIQEVQESLAPKRIGSFNTMTVNIINVDPSPSGTLELASASLSAMETDGTVGVTVKRTGGNTGVLSATLRTRDETATDGSDYIGSSSPIVLTWVDGDDADKTIDIQLLTDQLKEADETFVALLSAENETEIDPLGSVRETTVTIIDVPPKQAGVIEFARTSADVRETDGVVSLSLVRRNGSDGSISVLVNTLDITAQTGADYTGISEPIAFQWADGDTAAKSIDIRVNTDDNTEPSETFKAVLTVGEDSDPRVLGEDREATVTIIDVPPPPRGTVQFAAAEISTSEAQGVLQLQVERNGGSSGSITALVSTSDGSAVEGEDYTGLFPSQSLTWADGDTTPKQISITILEDKITEKDETFTVTLTQADEESDDVIGSPEQAVVTIMNIDLALPGSLEFSVASVSVKETDDEVTINVTRSGGSDGSVSVRVSTSDDTATDGQDYTGIAKGEILSWADGETQSKSVSIPILNDSISEPLERFNATLTAVNSADSDTQSDVGNQNKMVIDIVNVDPPAKGIIEFALTDIAVTQTDGTARLQVIRRDGDAGTLQVQVSTSDGSARNGTDYNGLTTPLILAWADGDTSPKIIDIELLSDTLFQGERTFNVILKVAEGTPESALGTKSTAAVNIKGVAPFASGNIEFVSAAQRVSENAKSVTAEVQRVGGSARDLTVQVLSQDGSASAGLDYTPLDPQVTLIWKDGDTSNRSVTIPILEDALLEDDEKFTLVLSAGSEGVVGQTDTQTVTITDATAPGLVTFAKNSETTEEDAGTVSLIVNRSDGTDGAISVKYNTVADTAVAEEDFIASEGTLEWADNDDSPKSIIIKLNDDAQSEDSERFFVELSNATPYGDDVQLGTPARISVNIAQHTEIPLNAGVIAFEFTELSVDEDAGTISIPVVRDGGDAGEVSVDYTVASDSATANTDFEAVSGTLTWANNEAGTKEINLNILTDVLEEPLERFSLLLSNPKAETDHDVQLGDATLLIDINDTTERGTVQLLVSSLSVDERDEVAVIQVERVNGGDGELFAGFNITSQSAELGVDFNLPDEAQLRWADGETGIRELRIPIVLDTLNEEDETFALELRVEDEPELVNASARNMIVLIRNSETGLQGPVELVIVSGDNQVADQGDTLEPLVLAAQNEAGEPVSERVAISWSVFPEGSAELLSGTETISDSNGQTSNQVTIVSNGFIRIVATVTTPEATNQEANRVEPNPLTLEQGQIAFTVRAGLQARPDLSPNQASTGTALDDACDALDLAVLGETTLTSAQSDLLNTCRQLLLSDTLPNDLDRLAHEEYFIIAESITDTTQIQLTNVYSRINAIRSGKSERFDLSNLQLNYYEQTIPGTVINAAQNALTMADQSNEEPLSGGLFSQLGFFASGSISKGEVDGDGVERDTDISTHGITLGADYRISDTFVVGAGLGFVQNNSEFSGDRGGADVNGTNLTLFGTWYEGNKGYLDMVLDIGQNSYDLERQVNVSAEPDAFATADTDASVFAFNVGAGKNFQKGTWEFGPYARFSYINASVDGFNETVDSPTSFGSALDVESHKVKSVSISIGGQLSKTISTSFGVMVPQLRFEIETENETRKDGITASFSADPDSTPFTLEGNERDSSFANIGLGSSVLLKNGKSGFLFYETRAAHDTHTQHWLKMGFRMEF